MPRKRTAVLGASGLVGQRFCQLLTDHPYFEEPDLYSWQRSENKKLSEVLKVPEDTVSGSLLEKRMVALDTAAVIAEDYDLIFSAVPSSMEVNVELELSSRGGRIFTNSGMNRMRPDVPIVVPEVNDSHLSMAEGKDGYIIANGNCSSIGLVLPLKPLLQFSPKHVEVTTMQALSGAGYPGVPSLDAISNIVPFIASEEEKIAAEVPKMLGTLSGSGVETLNLPIDATCTRVPVVEGHTESITVTFEHDIGLEEAGRAMATFTGNPQKLELPTAPVSPVIVRKEDNRPQPFLDLWNGSPNRARGMSVTVGRIRARRNQLRFIALSHNTVRGAAGGSVLNAELAYRRGLL